MNRTPRLERSALVGLRVSVRPETKDHLEQDALSTGHSVSWLVRRVLEDALGVTGAVVRPVVPPEPRLEPFE